MNGYQYAAPNVVDRARDQYFLFLKSLRNDFLARTTPELNVLVGYLNEVITAFFTNELPGMLGDLAWEVVKDAKLAQAKTIAGYKISATSFTTFRSVFERRFLQRLVPFTEDEMLKRVREQAKPRHDVQRRGTCQRQAEAEDMAACRGKGSFGHAGRFRLIHQG